MEINPNISAIDVHRDLARSNLEIEKRIGHIATGTRINKASDDAAGLAISERMRAKILGFTQEVRNLQGMYSREQVATGGLEETHDLLQRMRRLAIQASNDTLTSSQKESIQEEIRELQLQIDSIAENTEYNNQALIQDVTSENLGVENLDVVDNPEAAIETVDEAIDKVSERRGEIGGRMNRYSHQIDQMMVNQESLVEAELKIRGADIASEIMNLTKAQTMQQVQLALVAQANINPQNVIELLNSPFA